ncbi:MAG: PfkB family carbohydrate kinase, partial [Oscillospiraceae bacterium]
MFDKIVTVSVNPALDVTLWVQTMDFSEPNLTTRETVYAGGKSINISRVLSALHTSSRLLGICGEDHFPLFSSLLKKDRVDFSFLTVLGGVRENLTLIVPDKRVLKINRAGCPVPTHAMKELRDRIQTETADCKRVLLVFAGSLPPNLTADAYKEFILSFRREGVFFALDTAFFNLNDIREIAPFIIKPNLVEFQAMCGHDLKTEEDVVKSCKPLTPYVAHILVSLGSEGLVYVGE